MHCKPVRESTIIDETDCNIIIHFFNRWFLASVIIGCGFGYTYMYIIYQSRMKFDKHCGTVALLASAYMSVASSLLFMRGMVSL